MSSPTNQPAAIATAEDTAAKDATVPMWLIVVAFLMVFWGAVYFDRHGGWFEPQVYAPYVSMDDLKSYQVSGGPNPFEQGRAIYNRTCVTCHGPAAAGQPGTFPPLAGSDWVNEQEPGRMVRLVLQGLSGPGLMVKGQPFNTGSAMVPWNSLSDDDIAAVITFVRGNAEWGNKASPVTPEQVKIVRDKVQKSHPMSYTPTELEGIPPAL